MTVTNPNIELYCGNYFKLNADIVDVDNASVPLDITGMTVKWAMSKGSTSSYLKTPVLQKTTANGLTVVNAALGSVSIEIFTADTATMKPGNYYWELELTDAGGERAVVAVGSFTLKLNVENT